MKDDLVWPPPDAELDALVALPLLPGDSPPPDAAPAAHRPLAPDAPADVLHGLADFAERRIAGDVVLHRPPSSAPHLGAWVLGAVVLALSTYIGYVIAAGAWP